MSELSENSVSSVQSDSLVEERGVYDGKILPCTFLDRCEQGYLFSFGDDDLAYVSFDEFFESPRVGEKLELYIERKGSPYWIASFNKAINLKLWDEFEQLANQRGRVRGKVIGYNHHGLIVDVKCMRAFVPRRQIEIYEEDDLKSYLGLEEEFEVIRFDPKDANMILSRRSIIEAKHLEEREVILSKLQVGQNYDATVRRVMPYGVFIDIGFGIEGLVHRSNLSWGREEPSELFNVGDPIKVQVLEINEHDGKIAFGHKQLREDPWKAHVSSLVVGQVVKGRVVTLANFGAFIEIAEGVEGLVHNSEISWSERIRHPKQVLQVLQEVEAKVVSIDLIDRKLKLSIKALEANPWLKIAEEYPVGSRVNLSVSSIVDFGLFVSLGHNLEGLIHANDISWKDRIESLDELYKVGDKVDCVVLSIDVENSRASLGIKQLTEDPWEVAVRSAPIGKQIEVTVKRFTRFGAFVGVTDDIDGLIHISEMSDERVEKPEDIMKIGDSVTATVISCDKVRRKIGLSLIQEPFEPTEEQISEQSDVPEVQVSSRSTLAEVIPEELMRKI